MTELSLGSVLANRYRLDAKLGEGGMAVVYRAYDRQRHVNVAIKALKEDFAEDAVFVRKFRREAQHLAHLEHPHIIRFYEFYDDRSSAFLVLDFIDGLTLRTLMRRRDRPMTPGEVLGYLRPICAALSYAHREKVIHCDLKPANVMIDWGGRVFLSDFGIARFSESATVTFSTPGTAAYMAPEQWRGGEEVSAATDVYALGVILYELLTGCQPFTGESISTRETTREKIMREHLGLTPPQASRLNPRLPAAFDPVLLRCLSKEPRQRYQSAGDLLAAFEGVCQQLGLPAVPVAPAARTAAEAATASSQATGQSGAGGETLPQTTPPLSSTKMAGLFVVVGGAFMVIVIGGALVLGAGKGTSTPGGIPPTMTPGVIRIVVTATPELATATEAGTATPKPSPLPPTDTQRPAPTPTLTPTAPPPTDTPALAGGATQTSSKDRMVEVYVPAGEFLMGSLDTDPQAQNDEKPQHAVSLDAFWIDRTEVTTAMYALCVNAGACPLPVQTASRTHPNYYGNPAYANYPAIFVNWDAAASYCAWAGGRLSTEAEWEKAARGTQGQLYPWGDAAPGPDLANFNFNAPAKDISAVGSYPAGASPYGVLDMAGNVWEWVQDWYDFHYYDSAPTHNPVGPSGGAYRGMRGGSYAFVGQGVRSAYRGHQTPDTVSTGVGIRCVR